MIFYILYFVFVFSQNVGLAGECPVVLEEKKSVCAEQSLEIEALLKKHEKEKKEQEQKKDLKSDSSEKK